MFTACCVFIAVSVDGFIARPDGGLDWLAAFEQPGEDYGYERFFASADTVVVGRRTYEVVRGFAQWPYRGRRCVVLTHDASSSLHGEEFFAGDPSDLVRRLSQDGARRIYVDGGQVIRQFLSGGLVTQVTLSVIPVLLGRGIPLFGGMAGDIGLRLTGCRTFPSGVVQTEYEVVPPATSLAAG